MSHGLAPVATADPQDPRPVYAAGVSKRTGAILSFCVSTVLWIFVFVVPLLDYEPQTKWLAAAGLYGGSYVFFFLAIGLIGRDGFEAMKDGVRRRILRRGSALEESAEPGRSPSAPETSQISPTRAGPSD